MPHQNLLIITALSTQGTIQIIAITDSIKTRHTKNVLMECPVVCGCGLWLTRLHGTRLHIIDPAK